MNEFMKPNINISVMLLSMCAVISHCAHTVRKLDTQRQTTDGNKQGPNKQDKLESRSEEKTRHQEQYYRGNRIMSSKCCKVTYIVLLDL